MYTKQIITALAALTLTHAAILPARQIVDPAPAQNPSGIFSITEFSVAEATGSLYTTYTLHVTDPSNPSTAPSNLSTTCTTQTNTIPAITGFQDLPCDDPSVTWSFVGNGTGYNLDIKHNWGETVQHAIVTAYDNVTDSASAFFPISDVKDNPNDPAESGSQLDAPGSFDLEFSRYIS